MNKKVLGIIGGGQLSMMLCESAKKFGVKTIVLDPNKDCSASKLCDNFIKADYNNIKELETLFGRSDFVTYEFENINIKALSELDEKYKKCIPSPRALYISQDRLKEKLIFNNIGFRTVPFFNVETKDDIYNSLELLKAPCILKTRYLGYDGKGQYILNSKEDIKNEIMSIIGKEKLIIEKKINFIKEISIIGGFIGKKFHIISCNENVHKHGILYKSQTCKDKKLIKKSSEILKKYLTTLNTKGIMTIEFFVDKNNDLIINETAPRVHNSGHHTTNSNVNSQFDFIFFNILDKKWEHKVKNDFVMFNLIGDNYKHMGKLKKLDSSIIVKDYFKKEIRKNRKMAHINVPNKNKKLLEKIERILGK